MVSYWCTVHKHLSRHQLQRLLREDTMAPTQPILLLSLFASAAGFIANTPLHHRPVIYNADTRTVVFGGAAGRATTLEGKAEKIETVKGLLEKSQMIFTARGDYLTVAETQQLRRSLPEGTTMSIVKNKLMARALEGSDYEAGIEILKGVNMWFFIEEDIGASIKAFNTFSKETDKRETHFAKGGVMDGQVLDTAGVTQVSKLPSKIELITKIAAGVNAVPLKLARVVKAPNSKLARAIKLATVKEDE